MLQKPQEGKGLKNTPSGPDSVKQNDEVAER